MSYSNLYAIYQKLRELDVSDDDATEVMEMVHGLVISSVERMAKQMLLPGHPYLIKPKDDE
jgi:hypothetical protein